MKDAVIFHPTRTTGERAGTAVGMEQNELATEYTESAHPYKQPAEVLRIADETKNRTGYVLFPKVTKFSTWLLSRYGKRLEAELTGRYIRPFMFARESCPTSAYTFVVTPAESFLLYRDNEEYRKRIDSGRYIYVEGHICINDPEYVLQGRQGLYMTRWANAHVDECCLRFLNVFETDEDYEFNLGYVCSDEEYNRHYIDFVTGGKNMTEEEVNERASQIVMKMPQKPGEALKYLVEESGKARRKKISAQELSERCGVSKRTVYYWLEEEYQLSAEAFVRIVVGLHLPPYISMRFMNVCGVMLQFYGVHMMYWKILNCFFMDTIYEVNRHMRDAGFPAMTEGIE